VTVAEMLGRRALEDPAWLRVIWQYQAGRRAFPDPFRNRDPEAPRVR
jgi:hypothetical protein